MTETQTKKFLISAEMLLLIGSGTFEVVASPLPDDARVIDCQFDKKNKMIALVVESKNFTGDAEFVAAPIIRRVK